MLNVIPAETSGARWLDTRKRRPIGHAMPRPGASLLRRLP